MSNAAAAADTRTMAEIQGATSPAWLGRTRGRLLLDALGGVGQNWRKLWQLLALVAAYLRPKLVRRRLQRLQALGHIDALPTVSQLLVAGRDQMIVSAAEETRVFYRSQGIPWVFHNVRRFLSGPATMLDPIGLFSPRDTLVEHVLQTFHRHPLYDLQLLSAHEGGVAEMARQANALLGGTHPNGRALTSLIEDGSYHGRLPAEIAAFQANPQVAARPIPAGLVHDAHLMLAMDQFKDLRGFARYASRLRVGAFTAVRAWVTAGFDEFFGGLLGLKLGPQRIEVAACDSELVALHPGA